MSDGSLLNLCLLSFLFGLRHGLDVDHLVVIDGIVRLNVAERPIVSRWSGVLFSIGHGLVVVAWCGLAAAISDIWDVPQWLHLSGFIISISFLLGLGMVNILAAIRAAPGADVGLVGFRARLTGEIRRPQSVLAVGGMFALSFDTISQAAVIGFAGLDAGGWAGPLAAGASWAIGMVIVDGSSGLVATRLLSSRGSRRRSAQRLMALAIGSASTLIGLFLFAAAFMPELAEWKDMRGLWLAGATFVLLLLVYGVTRLIAPRRESGSAWR
jgi:high-affinity nickel-transport protein